MKREDAMFLLNITPAQYKAPPQNIIGNVIGCEKVESYVGIRKKKGSGECNCR